MIRLVSRLLISLAYAALLLLPVACGHQTDVNNQPGSGIVPGGGGGGGGGGGSNPGSFSVTATDPPADAIGVQPGEPIVASFSNPIAPATANAGSFLVTDDSDTPVSGAVTVSDRNASFKPAKKLDDATLYHARLTTAIQDNTGQALASDFTWSFTTSKDAWTSTPVPMSTPTGRIGHTAVWTGKEMIVWGGTDTSTIVATGARYDPATDTWAATASTSAAGVLARTDHTAIWTGKEMIVWGGSFDGLGVTNSGGRYNPATNTWTATLTPPPSASILPRSQHTAVWTDKEMIIWGGDIGGMPTATGGRFNPTGAGSWAPTSTKGEVPSARLGHTAVWTGTEMIIWGGTDAGGLFTNSGARYDPTTDTWSKMTTTGAPIPRTGHTAIWTGKEMIVWGGDDGSGPRRDGARYDPATDTWHPIQDAPIARSGHTAIWTGTEMIVWGGDASSNLGAAYNPAHDTWRTITATGAPSARSDHTAVWTGTEMIVWGGIDSTGVAQSGGRYAP